MASLITAGNKPAQTIYGKSVKAPSFNMLKPGANNAKLGGIVTAKMWQGFHMYSLTLEERATCPTDCEQWENCFLPGTRVLTDQATWANIETLQIGQRIAAFDEERPSTNTQRKTKWATVEALAYADRPSVELITNKGSISTAEGHLFLARKDRSGYQWYKAGELQEGDVIKYVISPWEENRSYESGRLRGFVEGEGTVGTYGNNGDPKSRLAWAQVPGDLNDEINDSAKTLGFQIQSRSTYSGINHSNVIQTEILGGWREVLKFLGVIRPTRLFKKLEAVYENHGIDGRGSEFATITKVRKLGTKQTVMIKTSTKTLVAGGFAAHNCYGNNMPFAHRFNHRMPGFYDGLETQLEKLSKKHEQGFVVRLHVLGDFFSPAYIEWWEYAINKFPKLHVFGYTHRDPKSTMGQMLESLNFRMPNRWAIRFSDEPMSQMSAHVVDKGYVPRKGLEVVCPEQLGQAKSCADCGLCWSARNRKIMFVEH